MCYNLTALLYRTETFGHSEVKQALLESAQIGLGSLKPVPEGWQYIQRIYRTIPPNLPKVSTSHLSSSKMWRS
ncbi:unnamed protein product [Penicillium roqueforti FM164]|uniref:Genomic scaffold, ProqFM164S02 n=1 Tax=Penicillium roqueforti (strain FM164) TaxID=1365484 RepID=W6Q2S6_PENRF|nr:unnamed protein product [Penicillium roqueforti FM164]